MGSGREVAPNGTRSSSNLAGHVAAVFTASELKIPPPKQGVAKTLGAGGTVGRAAFGLVKLKLVAGLPISDEASRGVNGFKPQRHSINLRIEV